MPGGMGIISQVEHINSVLSLVGLIVSICIGITIFIMNIEAIKCKRLERIQKQRSTKQNEDEKS
jgi:uncharacterized membrane protein (DUF106 family)